MYIRPTTGYYDQDGSQHTRKGLFLILMQHNNFALDKHNFRAIVRKVALSQFGHFMMGTARIKGESITISGSYGNMGLPCDTKSDAVWNACTPVPEGLHEAWNKGGGHNSVGSEAHLMRLWANENIDKLYNVKIKRNI